MSQLLATRSLTYPETSPAAPLEEMASIEVPTGDLEGKANGDLPDLAGGPDLSSRASIRIYYRRVLEV